MDSDGDLSTVARETFEFSIVPWAGRKYEEWVRAWARRHPRDPSGLIQLPTPIFKAFQGRTPGRAPPYQTHLSRQQAEALGYPSVPGESDLTRVRKELKDALGRCDWDRAHDLDAELRDLQERVAAMRVTALRTQPLTRS